MVAYMELFHKFERKDQALSSSSATVVWYCEQPTVPVRLHIIYHNCSQPIEIE